VKSFLVLLSILLFSRLITVLQYHVSIKLEVEGQLVNQLISPVYSFFVGELGQVVRGLGVVCVEGLDDLFILLLLSQLFLVNAPHLVHLVCIEEIWVIIHVLAISLFLNYVVRSLAFGSFATFL
jgi:hypothetical protein